MPDLFEIASTLERAAADLRALVGGAAISTGDEHEWPAWRERNDQKHRLRDPKWPRRGELAYQVEAKGGRLPRVKWMTLAVACGYTDGRSLNGFFSGRPPMFQREGADIVLTTRGKAAAAFWRAEFGHSGRRRIPAASRD
jgi:hypothetical protein